VISYLLLKGYCFIEFTIKVDFSAFIIFGVGTFSYELPLLIVESEGFFILVASVDWGMVFRGTVPLLVG